MDSLEILEERLRKLEEKIKEAKLHLPALSLFTTKKNLHEKFDLNPIRQFNIL